MACLTYSSLQDAKYYACEYFPAGNVIGQFPYAAFLPSLAVGSALTWPHRGGAVEQAERTVRAGLCGGGLVPPKRRRRWRAGTRAPGRHLLSSRFFCAGFAFRNVRYVSIYQCIVVSPWTDLIRLYRWRMDEALPVSNVPRLRSRFAQTWQEFRVQNLPLPGTTYGLYIGSH